MSPSITRTQKEKKKNKVDSSRIVTSRITYAALMANQIKPLTPCCRAPPTPKGFQPFTETLESETFDWNSVEKDSNLELWAVRIPKSVRYRFPAPCHLELGLMPYASLGTCGYLVGPETTGWLDDCPAFFPPGRFAHSACPI